MVFWGLHISKHIRYVQSFVYHLYFNKAIFKKKKSTLEGTEWEVSVLILQLFLKSKIIPNEFIFFNGALVWAPPEADTETRIWVEVVSLRGDSRNHPAGCGDVRPGREESREAVSAIRWPLWVTRHSPAQKHGRWCRSHLSCPKWEAGVLEYPSTLLIRYWLRAALEMDTSRLPTWAKLVPVARDSPQAKSGRARGLKLPSDRWGDYGYRGEPDRTQTAPATLGIFPRIDSTFKCLLADTI